MPAATTTRTRSRCRARAPASSSTSASTRAAAGSTRTAASPSSAEADRSAGRALLQERGPRGAGQLLGVSLAGAALLPGRGGAHGRGGGATFQALAHEAVAGVGLQVLRRGLGVAAPHLLLLRRHLRLSGGGGVGHLLLLRRRLPLRHRGGGVGGPGRGGGDKKADSQQGRADSHRFPPLRSTAHPVLSARRVHISLGRPTCKSRKKA